MEAGIVNAVVGFASGIGVAVVGALATTLIQSIRQERKRLQEAQTEIYYRLMMLRAQWWSMVLEEGHRERLSVRVRREIHDTAWRLADILRTADDVRDLEDIATVLFSEGFETAYDRYKEMDRIISRLGRKVNPKYSKAVGRISAMNLSRGMEKLDRQFSAPTALL
jgi:hypothetical protein